MAIRNLFLLLCGALLLCSCSHSDPPADTQAVLEAGMDASGIVGLAAVVVRDGEVASRYYLGWADIEKERPVEGDTLFMIASISKPVTATAVMMLAERGQIDLDENADAYLPFALENPHHPGAKITPRMLLTHTSSLRDDWDTLDPLYTIESGGGDSPYGLETMVRNYFLPGGDWYDLEANFDKRRGPGERWEYCNLGFGVLGLLVEAVDGRGFDQFCEEEIFAPLGMTGASWFLRDADVARLAIPYEVTEDGPLPIGHYGYPSYPDGQLRTTAEEYARFVSVFLLEGRFEGGRLLKEETVREFLTVPYPDVADHQAIAWNYDEFESFLVRRYMGYKPAHTGWDPGVETVVVMDPENDAAAILFLNSTRTNSGADKTVYVDILGALFREAGMERGER